MKTGIYKHYKGKLYEVLGVVMHSETSEKLVLYKPLYEVNLNDPEYGVNPLFVRPYEMFNGYEDYEGKKVKRFEYIPHPSPLPFGERGFKE